MGASTLAFALTLTTGCSKKSVVNAPVDPNDPRDKGTPTTPKTTPPAVAPAFSIDSGNIVGNWQLVGITYKDQTTESEVSEGTSHFFSFGYEYEMTYQTIFSGGYSDSGWYYLSGSDLVIHFSSGEVTANGITMTSDDDMILPDSNPAISTVKSRHYRRISDDNKAYILNAYGIN